MEETLNDYQIHFRNPANGKEGFAARKMASIDQAIEDFEAKNPRLVILDVSMVSEPVFDKTLYE